MSVQLAAAVVLVLVPIGFNLAFFELGRTFDYYPNILREPTHVILRRFHAGGTPLLLRWQALLVSALAMLPVVALLAVVLNAAPALTVSAVVIGSAAALVQVLGLVRWPFAVPELARQYVAAEGPNGAPTRQTIEVVFATLHRLLGVGIGEHLGYLLTGLWTILAAVSIVSTTMLTPWLGWIGVVIGAALLLGSLEFVGPNEKVGWSRWRHRADRVCRLVHLARGPRDRSVPVGARRVRPDDSSLTYRGRSTPDQARIDGEQRASGVEWALDRFRFGEWASDIPETSSPRNAAQARNTGEWPSGKAPDSGSGDRRFESFLPSQTTTIVRLRIGPQWASPNNSGHATGVGNASAPM